MKTIFYIFLMLPALAPLPFGMVYEPTQAVFAVACFGLVAAFCLHRLAAGQGPLVGLNRIWPETAGLVLVMAWALLQMSRLTPAAWQHPLWAEAAGVLQGSAAASVGGGISLSPGGGLSSLIRLASYAAVFWLALQLGRDRRRAAQTLKVLVLAGTAYALYGLVMYLGDFGLVLWVEKSVHADNLTGTFINRNNFATYLGLVLLCAIGLYMTDFFRAQRTRRVGRDRRLYLTQEMFVKGAPRLACILILLTALFLTHSRAGITCFLTALLIMGVFMGLTRRNYSRYAQAAVLLLAAVLLSVFFLSGEGWVKRLMDTDLERETRLQRYAHTWAAVQAAPFTGYGLGSYQAAFPMFADEKTSNSYKAHNDWLEMMFELGVPAAVLWFAVIGGLALRCLAGFFRRRRDHLYPVAGFCAVVLVALHSLVDFSLQIPAVAVTFVVVSGLGVAQSKNL